VTLSFLALEGPWPYGIISHTNKAIPVVRSVSGGGAAIPRSRNSKNPEIATALIMCLAMTISFFHTSRAALNPYLKWP